MPIEVAIRECIVSDSTSVEVRTASVGRRPA